MLKFLKSTFLILLLSLLPVSAYALDVIPSGECIGVKMYTDGLMVVDTSAVTDKNGRKIDIATAYGIEKGDIITKINGKKTQTSEMLSESISESCGNDITLTVRRGGKEEDKTITPADTVDGFKLGLWLRDSTAGLGTITFYKDNQFAALGHGICDVDTGSIMPISRGIIQKCTVTSVEKGSSGSPGAISGDINGIEVGKITQNTEHGLFGSLNSPCKGKALPVAEKKEIKTGDAKILADVDGNGVKEYSIEIKRIFPSVKGTKDMVINVTDDQLIAKTGGIIQGMSGSPIIQNGKLVGAVTHVFVNDPTRGYGIFIENMLVEAEKISD